MHRRLDLNVNPLILIPARMAATRLPDKPLADIGGAPMIVRAWRQAVLFGPPVAVAAGDRESVDALESAGGPAVRTVPGPVSDEQRSCSGCSLKDEAPCSQRADSLSQ